jgi:phosphoribosylanthranilate isomerase
MQQRTRIKICGITRIDDLQASVQAGADAVGFVFYPDSPRCVTLDRAAELASRLPPFVTPVALFGPRAKRGERDSADRVAVSW